MKIGKWSDTVIKDCDIVVREISTRRSDNEVQCMIMYASRDRNMLGEVSG